MPDHSYFANLIWQIADLLRGPYRPPQYERVMLPMTVLRRFDCVLARTKGAVLRKYDQVKDRYKDDALDKVLNRAADQRFHNHSPLDFEKLKGDPDNIEKHLVSYIKGFSANVRTIFEYFEFENEIEKMREANILYLVVSKFCDVDLHPDRVPNEQMGLIFENLIRRFNELANETAGDHFTPREVIRAMVNILFINDDKLLATPGTVRKLLDPACGTGGMLAEAQNYLREHHAAARLFVYGQDYNPRAFATAASDMLMKQVDHNGAGDNVRYGDSFTDDHFAGETFDYLLANPPFGVDWKKQQKEIQQERDKLGFSGRFGAGLPRVNEGSLLFLQHMISKFEPVRPAEHKHGSRVAIVFSGSPLFTGGAGSGESDIRKWIIENDWLEAIVALPEQMFYNSGIGTYIWIVTNRKEKRRKGKIQLLDAREFYVPMRRSMGDKRRKIGEKEDGRDQVAEIVQLYGRFADGETSKIFDNADFGYTRVTVERPLCLRYQMTTEDKARFLDACPHLLDDVQAIDEALGREPQRDWNAVRSRIEDLLHARKSPWKATEQKLFRSVFTQKDPEAEPVAKREEAYEPDADVRDFENVPLKDDIDAYFGREVRPHVPDAWMDRSKDKVGYEINFNRHFYKYTPPRLLEEIDRDLKQAEEEIMRRQALITRALTRGLDPRTPFRDSGIPWLGEIPAHWKIIQFKFATHDLQTGPFGSQLHAEEYITGGTPVVNPSHLNSGTICADDRVSVDEATAERLAIHRLSPGDVVFARRGELGRCGVVEPAQAGWLCGTGSLRARLRLDVADPHYVALVFTDTRVSDALTFESVGSTMDNLNTEILGSCQLAMPPLPEQRAIVALVAAETAQLDGLRSATERTIALLKERRAALIAAAVTGTIDVGAATA